MVTDIAITSLISYNNITSDKSWGIVRENLEKILPNYDKVRLLIKDVTLVNPCHLDNYMAILKMDNVILRFFGENDKYAETSKGICILMNIDTSKIEIEPKVVVEKESVQAKRNRTNMNRMLEKFTVDGKRAVFRISDTDINSITTIQAIKYAALKIYEDYKVTSMDIDFSNCNINESCFKNISELINSCRELGINIDIISDIEQVMKNITLSLKNSQGNDNSGALGRMKRNTVGILVKYKNSNGLDTFGRRGRGEIAFSRVAIFRGFDENDPNIIIIDTIHRDDYKTKVEKLVDNDFDEDVIDRLPFKTERIQVSEIGFYNETIGSTYNFLYPEQQKLDESSNTIIGINVDGTNIRRRMCMPERIKFILDEYGVKYNKSELEASIERNKAYLASLSDEESSKYVIDDSNNGMESI